MFSFWLKNTHQTPTSLRVVLVTWKRSYEREHCTHTRIALAFPANTHSFKLNRCHFARFTTKIGEYCAPETTTTEKKSIELCSQTCVTHHIRDCCHRLRPFSAMALKPRARNVRQMDRLMVITFDSFARQCTFVISHSSYEFYEFFHEICIPVLSNVSSFFD